MSCCPICRPHSWLAFSAAALVCAVVFAADEPSAAPPVSSLASPAALLAQVESYVETLDKATADEETFAKEQARIARESNAVIVLAQALALHDEDHRLKRTAPALVAAAQNLAAASDYETAQTAIAAIKQAAAGSADDGETIESWEPVATMSDLMAEVQMVYSKLRRVVRPSSRFERQAPENAPLAAMLAVAAQAVEGDTIYVEEPADETKWRSLCIEMRDAAAELHKSLDAGDLVASQKALGRLDKSCHDCHETFRVELE